MIKRNDCPLCGKSGGGITVSSRDKEVIKKCSCGVVYKSIVDVIEQPPHYRSPKIWDKPFFKKRYKKIAKYIAKTLNKECFNLLDIGCGNGSMLKYLGKRYPKALLEGVEPSTGLHKNLEKQTLILHKLRFDDLSPKKGKYDLIICMGVDYLFTNHDAAMKKLKTILSDGGHIYIERNVFIDMKSFVGRKVTSDDILYWNNPLITTWFTEEQMEKQLEKYFVIEDKLVYGEETSKNVGWLCSRK